MAGQVPQLLSRVAASQWDVVVSGEGRPPTEHEHICAMSALYDLGFFVGQDDPNAQLFKYSEDTGEALSRWVWRFTAWGLMPQQRSIAEAIGALRGAGFLMGAHHLMVEIHRFDPHDGTIVSESISELVNKAQFFISTGFQPAKPDIRNPVQITRQR